MHMCVRVYLYLNIIIKKRTLRLTELILKPIADI